jgi:hypothetical protein
MLMIVSHNRSRARTMAIGAAEVEKIAGRQLQLAGQDPADFRRGAPEIAAAPTNSHPVRPRLECEVPAT